MSYLESPKILECLKSRFLDKVRVPSLLYLGGSFPSFSHLFPLHFSQALQILVGYLGVYLFLHFHVKSVCFGWILGRIRIARI